MAGVTKLEGETEVTKTLKTGLKNLKIDDESLKLRLVGAAFYGKYSATGDS